MTTYTWLLFDADGTLFDFQGAEDIALRNTPPKMGVVMPSNYASIYHKINASLWKDFEAETLSAQEVRTRRFQWLFEELSIVGDSYTFSETFLKELINATTFLAGAKQLLSRLRQRFNLALLTNGFTDVQHARIEQLEIGDLFDPVVISEEVGVAKPNPAIFDIALTGMGHPDKDSVLMIGDSLSSDIQGGVNAGMDTCWFNPASCANETDVVPTYEINHLNELLTLLATED
ncbi:YjjG family noncanonical pyrimidine nucleotidase [Candidatus Bipolaricaulota bacterium]|nr:YjjG family noncanonical pyrimidine nucleotidase [Candidatus Bipolaricaulota bacterium]